MPKSSPRHKIAVVLAAAVALGSFASVPARAHDGDRWDGWRGEQRWAPRHRDDHWRGWERERWAHDRWGWGAYRHGYVHRPPVVYAPPPVVIYREPRRVIVVPY